MDRKATAHWNGTLKDGQGIVSGESAAFHHVPYSFKSRFVTENEAESQVTNPEELIAAAHSACYSMAVTAAFEKAQFTPRSVDVTASVTIRSTQDGWSISHVHLILHADVPEITDGVFRDITQEAKEQCPVSKLMNAKISLEAYLDSAKTSHDSARFAPEIVRTGVDPESTNY
jgi:osmotically inducible protein OsmC